MGLDANRPLGGLKVIESSLLGPGLVATFLADLGADVVKVEPPSGDYIRQMTWPIVDGTSLLHLHTHRGKRSIALDLKTDDGLGIYRDLVREADVVVDSQVRAGHHRVRIIRAVVDSQVRIIHVGVRAGTITLTL